MNTSGFAPGSQAEQLASSATCASPSGSSRSSGTKPKSRDGWSPAQTSAVVTLVLGLLLTTIAPAWAQTKPFITKAPYAILIDDATGAILFQKEADTLTPPASMSKLMTLAVMFRALREGTLKMDDTFPVSENAWRNGGAPSGTSAMFAGLGERISVEDLIKGIAIQSGNDACMIVAEGMAGSQEAFAKRMIKEAREIGLERSTFGNATGLPHPDQLMSAREIAMLSRHLIKTYPEYYPYFGKRKFPYQPPRRNRPYAFYNRNPLLSMNIGADGLKTGHLSASGYGLAGSTVQNGQRLIVVVNGLKSARERRDEAAKLIAWGYKAFDTYKVFEASDTVGQARVWGGEQFYVPLRGDGDVSVLLPKGTEAKRVSFEVVYDGPLKAPIKEGDQVARLRVTTGNNSVNSVPLYAAAEVPQGSIVRRGVDSIAVLTLRWLGDKASGIIESVL
ncbi:MAG: D-alanyl-D-alanine carboxypeptidase family protein [Pseudomonadota bacterium]